uniref:Cytochrome c biogenesis protein Ccs1 n=1 Tax=Alsidium seaforthii TaxID=2007182 RepID=A0A1Z1MCX4_9FLOR|nr:cytochrome c biogenesis protein ccs1 [Bryothamnion seaforthii]ARW63860.1 cytochrome c biogenesis protein ccs1 [Bryothamnion seaforthii]
MLIWKFKNLLWSFVKKLSNLSFSILILFIIAFFSTLGSIIEQDQDLLYYQMNYPDNSSNLIYLDWKLIINLGLDHIFQTWWFICILLIFIFSLMSCSFSTQLPSLKNARRWKFISKRKSFNSSFYFTDIYIDKSNSLANFIYSLIRSNFFVFCQGSSIYSYKGLYGRIAPIFVHFSIITVLLGSMISFLFGFVVQEIVPDGEIFHVKNITHSGFFSRLPIDIWGRVEEFYIKYNSDSSIQQFFSKISIFYRNSHRVKSYLMSVNKPLRFNKVTLYQTNWKLNALRINLGSQQTFQKKLLKTSINNKSCWLANFYIDDTKQIFFVIFDLNKPILLSNSNGLIIGSVYINQVFYINNIHVSISNIISSTGLQIKVDSGVYFVYLGFFVLMLSTIVSYLSYSQVWIYKDSRFLDFLASTNRAILFFEEDILDINLTYNYYSNQLIHSYFVDNILK